LFIITCIEKHCTLSCCCTPGIF